MFGGRGIAIGAAAGVLLAGCAQPAEPHNVTATVPVATPPPPPTPTPTPTDPYAVPDVIDAAYLNRVFAALEAIAGDATRIIVREKTYPPEADDLHMAIYTGPALQAVRDDWLDALLTDPELADFRNPPGELRVRTREIHEVTDDCVFVAVDRDFSAVMPEAESDTVYMALKLRTTPPINPTPWLIERQAWLAEGVEEPRGSLCEPG